MISVIMPVWNGSRFIDRAIASVVAQTCSEWELLIIDDGSTDDTVARIQHWAGFINPSAGRERIRLLSTGRGRSGPQVGRNLGAEEARYDILAWLDYDDLYFPWRIESLLPFFDRHDLVFSPYEILEKGHRIVWDVRALWNREFKIRRARGLSHPSFEGWARDFLQRQNLSVPLGVAHRRGLFESVGGFQPGIVVGSDGVLWRRMADRGARIGYCPRMAGRYFVYGDSQARTGRPFDTGSFEIRKDHPFGSNGQYLDAEWFAARERRK